jgi:hypothetical protein
MKMEIRFKEKPQFWDHIHFKNEAMLQNGEQTKLYDLNT